MISKLRFRNLNHVRGDAIKRQWPMAEPLEHDPDPKGRVSAKWAPVFP